jgi:hypothetical protein
MPRICCCIRGIGDGTSGSSHLRPGADRDSDINALDAEINAVNDLIAVKCRG